MADYRDLRRDVFPLIDVADREFAEGPCQGGDGFYWLAMGGDAWEKKTCAPKARTIRDAIKKAAAKGKKRFLIDIGETGLSNKLLRQLSLYNVHREDEGNRIARLVVMAKGRLIEVRLNQ